MDDIKKILLIEDNQSHVELIKISLKKNIEFDIDHAESLKEADELLSNNDYYLVISDLRLPDGDGIEHFSNTDFIERFPFIVMTSFGDETRAVNALKAGFIDYFVKSDKSLLNMHLTIERASREINANIKAAKAEEALQLSEKKYRTIFNNSPVGIYRFNEDGILLDGNNSFFDICKYDLNDLRDLNVNKLIFPDQVKREGILLNAKKGELSINESELKQKNGKSIVVLERIMYFDQEEPYYESFIEDISERKSYEDNIRLSEQRLREVIDIVPHSIFAKDEDGQFLIVNKAFAYRFGLETEDIIGKLESEIEPVVKQMTNFQVNDSYVIEHNESLFIPEEVVFNHKGEKSILQTTKIPFQYSGSDKGAILGVSVDITEKTRSDEALLRVNKLESLGTLAGGIAHNFKNILAAMNLNLGILKMKPDAADSIYDKMKKLIDQATALATRFETFTAGGDPIKTVADIRKVITEAEILALGGSNCQGVLSFDADVQNVEIDTKQMNEVFMNLLINAKQAMTEGGRIHLTAKNIRLNETDITPLVKGDYVHVTVKDEGQGIPQNKINNIFDPFFTTKPTGKGLGLSSVHFIISKHGGHISVESEEGVGTTFHIYLPITKKQVKDDHYDENDIKKGEKQKVLVMDDDEMVLDSMMEFGEYLDFDIHGVPNGEEAIKAYQESIDNGNKFKAVILDLTIKGGMGGEETIKELIKIDPDVKGIVFSAHSNKPINSNYQDYGFVAQLKKPASFDQISNCIHKVINNEI